MDSDDLFRAAALIREGLGQMAYDEDETAEIKALAKRLEEGARAREAKARL